MILISLFVTLLLQFASCAHDTTCIESQKHFAEVCFAPKATEAFDLGWFLGSQPDDGLGYYTVISNDISRLHFAEILHGKLLTLQDNFTDSCFRANAQLGAEGLEANVTGFNGLQAMWDCRLSKDHFGLFLCDGISSGPSKFHENFNIYPVYTDHKNFQFGALCYPNGEVGWAVLSVKPTLSEEDKAIIAEQVKKLGFDFEDRVTTFGESCQK